MSIYYLFITAIMWMLINYYLYIVWNENVLIFLSLPLCEWSEIITLVENEYDLFISAIIKCRHPSSSVANMFAWRSCVQIPFEAGIFFFSPTLKSTQSKTGKNEISWELMMLLFCTSMLVANHMKLADLLVHDWMEPTNNNSLKEMPSTGDAWIIKMIIMILTYHSPNKFHWSNNVGLAPYTQNAS